MNTWAHESSNLYRLDKLYCYLADEKSNFGFLYFKAQKDQFFLIDKCLVLFAILVQALSRQWNFSHIM